MSRIDKLIGFLQESPSDPFIQHALALEYIKIDEHQKARDLFEKLLQENPDYVGSYYHLAKLLETMGQEQEALQVYEKGMEQARIQNDTHALGELRSAWEELSF